MEIIQIVLPCAPLFEAGEIVATPGARDKVTPQEIGGLLARHLTGDWGDLEADDKRANFAAVLNGGRIFSAYTRRTDGFKVYVITEEDRSATTVLRPEDY